MHADAESYFVPQNFSPSIWNMTECLKWEPILPYLLNQIIVLLNPTLGSLTYDRISVKTF